MSDLTERLRKPMPRKCEWVFHDYADGRSEGPFDPIRLEAAEQIDSLNRELAEARRERDEAIRVYTAVAQQMSRLMTLIGNIYTDVMKEKP